MKWLATLAAVLCAASWSLAQAQSYPAKPVRLIVPYSAGAGFDTFARALGQRMADSWGQPVQIENRPGGNAIIASEHVARSPADGYTLLLSDPSMVNNPSLHAKLPYAAADFAPITPLAVMHLVIVAHPSLPVNSLRELIDLAKSRPGELNCASYGTGSSAHLGMELLQAMAQIKLNHVPYKGTAPALTDLTAGRVQLMFATIGSALPHVRAGKLKVLAVGNAKRLALHPDIPTVAEAGLPGFEVSSWFGLHAPAGTPREVIARINDVAQKVLADPSFRQRSLDAQSLEAIGGSPEQFSEFMRSEAAKWGKVIREAKVRLE